MYIEGGVHVIGGFNVKINQKEQLTKLERGSDYHTRLGFISTQPVAFYDVIDQRAWLVDGASALLHLVRVSFHMDQTDPRSPYDWIFDENQLLDSFRGCNGSITALRTLKSWDNIDQPVYVKEQERLPDGGVFKRFSTFGERVSEIMHSLEILIDRQCYLGTQGGIKITQRVDRRKSVSGFDVLDVIKPLGPVGSRVKTFDSWGDGWPDFLPIIGALTLFGKGFGDLIRPDGSAPSCPAWTQVPTGEDYMASSVSTLKYIYEERLPRLHSGQGSSQMAAKLLWVSRPDMHPFQRCKCLSSSTFKRNEQHSSPAQLFVSPKSLSFPKGAVRIDLDTLVDTGAVVFANHGRFKKFRKAKPDREADAPKAVPRLLLRPQDSSTSQSGASRNSASNSASASASASASTNISDVTGTTVTVSSTSSPPGDSQQNDNSDRKGKGKLRKFLKRVESLKGG
jgi:hypothetical protein